MPTKKPRKIRSDSTVKSAEKRLGIENAIRNPDGTNARSDKLIGTLRKEASKKAPRKSAKKSTRNSGKKAGKGSGK
jgi:hypothetical protein